MQELVETIGIILKAVPIGEYDRRLVILTKDRGKITAFAKGARRQNNRFLGSTMPFCFGTLSLYEGRNSYNLANFVVDNYFETLHNDYQAACMGMYFLEVADFYTRENNDEVEMLRLLYQSLRALTAKGLKPLLVRYIFELKAIMVNGEFQGPGSQEGYSDSCLYAVNFIEQTAVAHLYTFDLNEETLKELGKIADKMRKKYLDYPFQSLKIMETFI